MAETPASVSSVLVEEIRRARTAAGTTQDAFGRAANFSPSHVSAVEGGTRALTMDYVRGADRALGTDGLFERLADKLRLGSASPIWFREWLTIEQEATSLLTYEPALVPGLLQTRAYAHAVLQADGTLTDDETDQRVDARMQRQAMLRRAQPPHFVIVLDECALRRPVGGPQVMREQLLDLAAHGGNVQVQVITSDVGMYPGVGGAFVLAAMPDGTAVVHLDTAVRGQVSDSVSDVATVRRKWETLRGYALPWRQSAELIVKVADELWT